MTLQERINLIYQAGLRAGIIGTGGTHIVSVKHDLWCPALKRKKLKYCTCEPEVELKERLK